MRRLLRKKEIKALKEYFPEEFIYSKERVEMLKDNDGEFIFINKKPVLFKYSEKWIYTLHAILENINSKKYSQIKVDKGAIRFVSNGADIMRPGIVKIDETIEKDKPVVIIEETYNKPLSIGLALFDYKDMQIKESGKVVKTIHFIGDEIWKKTL